MPPQDTRGEPISCNQTSNPYRLVRPSREVKAHLGRRVPPMRPPRRGARSDVTHHPEKGTVGCSLPPIERNGPRARSPSRRWGPTTLSRRSVLPRVLTAFAAASLLAACQGGAATPPPLPARAPSSAPAQAPQSAGRTAQHHEESADAGLAASPASLEFTAAQLRPQRRRRLRSRRSPATSWRQRSRAPATARRFPRRFSGRSGTMKTATRIAIVATPQRRRSP